MPGEVDAEALFERVVEELCCMAFADIGDFVEVNEAGELSFLPTRDMEARDRRAVASMRLGARGTVDIRLYDKPRSLSLLSRVLGFLNPRGGRAADMGWLDAYIDDEGVDAEEAGDGDT